MQPVAFCITRRENEVGWQAFFLDAVEGMRQSGDPLKGLGNATAIRSTIIQLEYNRLSDTGGIAYAQ